MVMGAAVSALSAWIRACTSAVMSASLRAREQEIDPTTTNSESNKITKLLVFIRPPLQESRDGNSSADVNICRAISQKARHSAVRLTFYTQDNTGASAVLA